MLAVLDRDFRREEAAFHTGYRWVAGNMSIRFIAGAGRRRVNADTLSVQQEDRTWRNVERLLGRLEATLTERLDTSPTPAALSAASFVAEAFHQIRLEIRRGRHFFIIPSEMASTNMNRPSLAAFRARVLLGPPNQPGPSAEESMNVEDLLRHLGTTDDELQHIYRNFDEIRDAMAGLLDRRALDDTRALLSRRPNPPQGARAFLAADPLAAGQACTNAAVALYGRHQQEQRRQDVNVVWRNNPFLVCDN